VSLRDVLNTNYCDWRVALCVTNGSSDLSRHIYLYDGIKLTEQLDKRCAKILAKKIRVDPSPPSILTNSPSITLPKALSCLLLPPAPASASAAVAPPLVTDRSSSVQDPSRSSTVSLSSTASLSQSGDPRVWLPLITKYLQPETQRLIGQLLCLDQQQQQQQQQRIYILFDLPDYNRFKFLQLVHDQDHDQEEGGEGEEAGEIEELRDLKDEILNQVNDESFIDLGRSSQPLAQQQTLSQTQSEEAQVEVEEEQDRYSAVSNSSTSSKARQSQSQGTIPSNRHTLAHPKGGRAEELLERDRSVSLDSGRGASPLKPPTQQREPPPKVSSAFVANVFSDEEDSATNTKPPTGISFSSSSSSAHQPRGAGTSLLKRRTSIDELRVALQSEPTQQQIQQQRQQGQPQGLGLGLGQAKAAAAAVKGGGKKKNFFGWKSSS
jgi:hypothetical protein